MRVTFEMRGLHLLYALVTHIFTIVQLGSFLALEFLYVVTEHACLPHKCLHFPNSLRIILESLTVSSRWCLQRVHTMPCQSWARLDMKWWALTGPLTLRKQGTALHILSSSRSMAGNIGKN